MPDSDKHTQEEKTKKPIDWTKVFISFIYFVLFPLTVLIIIGWILREWQRNKYAHQERMADKSSSENTGLSSREEKEINLKEKDLDFKEKELAHKERERKDKKRYKALEVLGSIAKWVMKIIPFSF